MTESLYGALFSVALYAAYRMADDEGGDRITRKLTHHTIAQMIGSSRETVSRTVRELQDRGLIAVTRQEITLTDRAGLQALSRRS